MEDQRPDAQGLGGPVTRAALLPILFGLFASAVVMTNAVSANVIEVGPFVFVAGTLLYPVTFLLTDILSEIYGKEAATRAVWTGLAAQILSVAFIQSVATFPSLDAGMGEAWGVVFLPTARIAAASMVAYLVAQLIDVRVFHFLRELTDGKALWLRNNGSTIASQGFDTLIFVIVAFAGTLPIDVLAFMILGQYTAKACLALLDTPFCYLAVALTSRLPEE